MRFREYLSHLKRTPIRVEAVQEDLGRLTLGFAAISAQLSSVEAKSDALATKSLHVVEEKIDALQAKLDALQAKVDAFETRERPEIVLSNDRDIIVQAGGYNFLFPATQLNHAVSYLHPDFDIGMRRFIAAHAGPGIHYIDVGANVGTLAAVAARAIGPTGRIVTIEPIPDLAQNIRRNVFLNGGSTPYEHHACCAGGKDAKGAVQFDVYEFDNRVSTLHSYTDDRSDQMKAIKVDIRPIGDLIPRAVNDLLIKLDAEGAELQLLTALLTPGGPLTGRTAVLVFEYAQEHCARVGEDPRSLVALLRAHGLQGFYIDAYSGSPTTEFGDDTLETAGNIVLKIPADHPSLIATP